MCDQECLRKKYQIFLLFLNFINSTVFKSKIVDRDLLFTPSLMSPNPQQLNELSIIKVLSNDDVFFSYVGNIRFNFLKFLKALLKCFYFYLQVGLPLEY